MLIADVPNVPAQEAPIVLVQAATPDVAQQPDYLLKACTEFSSGGGGPVDPAGMLAVFLENHQGHPYITPKVEGTIKLTQLEGTKHGELIPLTSGSGRLYYKYIAEPDYLGNDKAIFMAEFEGKRYKVVVNFVISEGIDDYNPKCPEPELIKLKKPATGSTGDSGYGTGYKLATVTVGYQPNPAFERDAAKARRPSTLR